jgi:hypothetical protein
MSLRGDCYHNTVAENLFHRLKIERIRRKTYATREEARQDVFNYSIIQNDSMARRVCCHQQTSNDNKM